jgi:hypothetical protein
MGMMVSPYRYATGSWAPENYGGGTFAYYDVSDIGSLWQDRARTTLVTTAGQAVGAIDDLSGGGRHLIAPADVNRPVYQTTGGAGGDKPYLDFNGSTPHRLVSAAFTAVAQPIFQMLAVKFDIVASERPWMDGIATSNRATLFSSTVSDLKIFGGSPDADTGHDLDTSDVVIGGLFSGASSVGYKDGWAGSAVTTGTNSLTGISLGARWNAGAAADGRFYGGFIALGNTPTSGDISGMTTWLGGLQGRTL